MKSSQRIKRVQLSVNGHEGITLFGLVCPDPHYKLSLKINKKLQLSLKSASPLEIQNAAGKDLVFSRFSDTTSVPDCVMHLFSNRSGAEFLFKKLKNIDYLFEIYDPENIYYSIEIISKLREIDTVTAVFTIELKTIKDKNQKYLFA